MIHTHPRLRMVIYLCGALLLLFYPNRWLSTVFSSPAEIKSTVPEGQPGKTTGYNAKSSIRPGSIYLLDAIQKTFLYQPSIQTRRSIVDESRGAIKITSGAFDWKLGASGGTEVDRSLSYEDPYTVHGKTVVPQAAVNLSKTTSFGPSMESSYTLKQYQYNTTYKGEGASEIPEYSYTENIGRFDFKVNVPLLPLVGDKNYSADTIANKLQYKASLYDLQAVISEAAYNTVIAYWNYVYAYKQLDILKGAMERAKVLLENTKALAKGGEVPKVEIENAMGNLADKVNSCYNAEQLLVETKTALAQTIGVSYDDLDAYISPADDFPEVRKEKINELVESRMSYITVAIQKRMEIGAMTERMGAAGAQVTSSRNHILPEVNVQFGLGYEGSNRGEGKENYFSATKKHQPGMDMSVMLVAEYPIGNNTAYGRYEQKTAQLAQLRIQQKELHNTIRSNVLLSVYALRNAVNELEKTEEAVVIYENAFNGERQKFRAGETTLLNIIDIHNRLDNVLINRLSVRKKTAAAIARLRYETGTLISFDDSDGSVSMSALVTVPTVNDRKPLE